MFVLDICFDMKTRTEKQNVNNVCIKQLLVTFITSYFSIFSRIPRTIFNLICTYRKKLNSTKKTSFSHFHVLYFDIYSTSLNYRLIPLVAASSQVSPIDPLFQIFMLLWGPLLERVSYVTNRILQKWQHVISGAR